MNLKRKNDGIKKSNNTQTNNNVSNSGSGNNITIGGYQPSVHINHFETNNNSSNPDIISYERTKTTELKAITPKNFSILAAFLTTVGFFANLAQIYSVLNKPVASTIYIISFAFATIFLVIAFFIKKNKHNDFKQYGFGRFVLNLELSDNGQMYKSKFEGLCPICSGKVRLFRPVDKLSRQTICVGVCNNNSNHLFSFEPTTFTGSQLERMFLI